MGRKLNTTLPSLRTNPHSQSPNLPLLYDKEQWYRDNQSNAYNRRHAARQAPELHLGDSVYIKDLGRPGSVAAQHHNPWSYIVLTDQGTVRRNRSHLVATDASGQSQSDSMTPKTPTPVPRAVSPAVSGSTPTVAEPSSPGRPQVTRSFHQRNLTFRSL
ncbi:retrovirus-related pol polyprotein from transposon opus [Elysia marginata]|uniref:Retrovirus-related pol polyprotein from transposon opus n=1 Tax=Elysia marginata TaxID=1093978 RepID=A0AAV4FBL8_9GAST|nr:retrovirus-related pol polyprotein from transposon opus [Elysia marginata]